MMRPAITFLNALDREKTEQPDGDGPLTTAVTRSTATSYRTVTEPRAFSAPTPVVITRRPQEGNINYKRPLSMILRLQKELGARTYREVGEKTFDHYVEVELGE